ncbi:hypothetical protein ACFQ1S_45195, partial [Kibdelosporangium lantanae]
MAGLDGADRAKVKEQFLRVFELALKDTAMATLNTAEKQAAAKATELDKGISDADWAAIEKELPELIRLNDQIRLLSVTVESAEWVPRNEKGELPPNVQKGVDEYNALLVKRSELFVRYPLLSQVDPDEFKKMSREDRRKALRGASLEVVANIATTRDNVLGGAVELWLLGPLVQ